MDKFGFSELECKIIMTQIERRDKYRKEFLKARTDPAKHAAEAGYVFDEALQRWLSMKVTTLQYFPANFRTISFGVLSIIVPMVTYGLAIYYDRTRIEKDIRSGKLRYKDRLFKFK